MPNYLKEAFKELELLNEETFSFDKDGAAELKKFYDGDTTDDYESIIDPEAETKDELEDSYEGKVIVACKICHGMQYKDPQDIVIDEESDYVNVGEECPACSAVDGYKIVGQVAPYCAECEHEHKEGEIEVDDDETDIEEALDEKRKARLVIESLKRAPKKHFEESLNEEKLTTLFDVVGGMLDGTMDRITINKKTGKKQAVGTKTPYDAAEDIGIDDDGYFVWVADEAGAKYAQGVADKFGLETKLDTPTKYIRDSKNRKFHIYIPEDRYDETVEQVVEESLRGEILDESGSNPRAVWVDAVRNELGKPAYTDSYPKRNIYRLKYVFDLEDKNEAEAFAEKARKLDHVKRVIGPKETSMWRGGPDVFMVNVMVDYPPIEQAVEESCGKLEESHDKAYIMSQILLKLEDEGYDVRSHKKDAIAYADGAAELIMISPDGYTVDKWFEDTKMNHPEDLLRFKKFSDLKESVSSDKLDDIFEMMVDYWFDYINEGRKPDIDTFIENLEVDVNRGIYKFTPEEFQDVQKFIKRNWKKAFRVARDEGDSLYGDHLIEPRGSSLKTTSTEPEREPTYEVQGFVMYKDGEITDEMGITRPIHKFLMDEEIYDIKTKEEADSILNNLVENGYSKWEELGKPELSHVSFRIYLDHSPVFLVGDLEARKAFSNGQLLKLVSSGYNALTESVENITVETDTDTIKVEPSEDGKVEVKTEPKEDNKEDDEEMIVPVSAETKDEIDMNDANFDETDADIDIDSIDDEGFDVLGESYLKKVYENVKSFKTSSSSIKDGKLMVEGTISFNSGKKAKTSFVFESISKTKRGKIKFLGENLNFSKSKSAFTLIAKPEGKKAVCESLTYNYVAKDSKSNKKLPVYGKVSK